jgi:DNA-binding MarR family transcriptional regulator
MATREAQRHQRSVTARYTPGGDRGVGRIQAGQSVSAVDEPIWCLAQQLLRARTKSGRFFPKDIFRDSAWDMMLELFLAGQKGRHVCVKELALAAEETPASAMRRIDRLQEANLIRRRSDPRDHRRVLVELTEGGNEAMHGLLSHILELSAKDLGK